MLNLKIDKNINRFNKIIHINRNNYQFNLHIKLHEIAKNLIEEIAKNFIEHHGNPQKHH